MTTGTDERPSLTMARLKAEAVTLVPIRHICGHASDWVSQPGQVVSDELASAVRMTMRRQMCVACREKIVAQRRHRTIVEEIKCR